MIERLKNPSGVYTTLAAFIQKPVVICMMIVGTIGLLGVMQTYAASEVYSGKISRSNPIYEQQINAKANGTLNVALTDTTMRVRDKVRYSVVLKDAQSRQITAYESSEKGSSVQFSSDVTVGQYTIQVSSRDKLTRSGVSFYLDITLPDGAPATAANPAPIISIDQPHERATVKRTFTISGNASDDTSVQQVDYRFKGENWIRATGTTSWSGQLDSSNVSDGTKIVEVMATDSEGAVSNSSQTVLVENEPSVVGASTLLQSTVTTKSIQISRNGSAQNMDYCSNGILGKPDVAITRVIVVIHGNSRGACAYANSVLEAAQSAGTDRNTLIVAPRFYANDETVPDNTMYWTSGGWKSGSLSQTSPYIRAWRISSYEVIDDLTAMINLQTYSNAALLVFAGHSAGGQFVSRYSASTHTPNTSVQRKYIIANPSSYLYLSPQRLQGSDLHTLTSTEQAACPIYNDYKYGLQNKYSYVSKLSDDAIRAQYTAATVTYLLGDNDTDASSGEDLDTGCEAQWQGSQRFERGNIYYDYIGKTFGSSVYSTHKKVIVPGVGHTASGMFKSELGKAELFN